VKNKGNLVFRFLHELTYFVPDGMLVLAIVSFFCDLGKYDFIITISLFIAYIGLTYGERYFHRLIIARDMVDDIVNGIEELTTSIRDNHSQHVTHDQFLAYVELMDSEVNRVIDKLRDESKGVA
jgi:hypothetical protein